MESLLLRTDLSDDASFIYDEDDDDNNAPLEDLKRYVATLNEQRDLDLENFKGLYDDDSDDDSDWGENMDFEKVTSDFLSYAMGKENKVRAGTPRSTTLSKSIILKTAKGLSISHSVKTPRGILTPKDANVFAFEQEEITNSQATKADPQGDFASIELTLSDMLSEILSDDWKLDADERKEIRNGEQDEQIVETDFDVKSADGGKLESNECGRTEIIEQQDKQQDQEKDKPVEDAIMQGAESPSAENMPMGLETEGSKAIGEASSVDTSVDTATSYLDLIQETQEVAIEENAPINDSADLIPTKTKLDAEENSNKASSHVEVDDELICEGVAPVEYSIASNYPITSDTCDREAVTDQNHFHIMAEHEFGAESAEQEVPERLTEDTKHECKAQQAPIEEDPYEWAYAIWRAKGLMGRTKEDDHQTPSKPQPSMSRKVNHAPIPPSEPKVFVIGTPVKESQSVTATTPGRDRAGQWNKRASGNFGNLIQRWKDKSESTPIHNLFSPAQSVQSVVASTPIKATEEGRKAERATIDIDKDTALSKKVRTDGIVALSTSGKYEVVAELRGNDKNSNEKVMTKTGNEEDAIIGMTIGDLKGRKSLFTPTPIKVLRTFLAQGEGSVGDMDDDSSISYDGLVCMSDQSQIANAQHAQGCACSSSAFSGNDVLEEFFLPQLGMACTCGTGKRSYNWRYDSDPTALEHILRPWQVSFCHSFGIRKGDQLVKAHHRSANMLAKAMRKWRSAHGMTRVRTVSCGVALNIWAQSCKFYVRSVRRQTDRGIRRIEMPNAMDCLTEMMSTSGRRMSVPASGHGFRTERAMTDGDSETEVEI
jgi:hypothetical protein